MESPKSITEPWSTVEKVLKLLATGRIDASRAMSNLKQIFAAVDNRKCWKCGQALKMHFYKNEQGISCWDGHSYEADCGHIEKGVIVSIR